MKYKYYLERLNHVPPIDIEELVNLSNAIAADKENLTWEHRVELSELVSERLLEGIRELRIKMGKDPGSGSRRF